MQLRFYAREGLVCEPGERRIVGQHPRYVGRALKLIDEGGRKTASYPATREPHECAAESDEGRRLAKLCRRDGSLWAADEATAAACGVSFVPVVLRDGAWVPEPAPEKLTSKAKPPKD